MGMIRIVSLVAVGSLVAGAGCVVEDDLELDSIESALNTPCPKWDCGSNSSKFNNMEFSFLYTNHHANPEGFWIRKAFLGSWPFEVDVVGHELTATSTIWPWWTLFGSSLTNLRMIIQNGTIQWALDVKAV